MILSCIVAVSENGVIGRNNDLPWRLSDDLKRFKRLTTGHTIIMGRKTFESIGRPLPNRTSIVISRNAQYKPQGATAVRSLEEALEKCKSESEVFVIGGAELFQQALPRAQKLYLTRVHAKVEGDVYLRSLDLKRWRLIEEERHEADDKNDYASTFRVYEREPASVRSVISG